MEIEQSGEALPGPYFEESVELNAITSSQNLGFYADLSRRLENTKKRSRKINIHSNGSIKSAFSSCD